MTPPTTAVMDDERVADLLQDALRFSDFLHVAFDPLRPRDCRITLAEVAVGEDLDELTGHAEAQVGAPLDRASKQGADGVLAFLDIRGCSAARNGLDPGGGRRGRTAPHSGRQLRSSRDAPR
jgi:hypothetical protein